MKCPMQVFNNLHDSVVGKVASKVPDLLSSYGRLYHNVWHISQMYDIHCQLIVTDWQDISAIDDNNIKSAIYYHDAIYDTSSKDLFDLNEKLSNELFKSELPGANTKISNLILATKGHFIDRPYDELTEWFIGLDLAALAAPWEMFKLNNSLIRYEFHTVTDEEWNKNRHWFLKHALQQDKIYRHPVMHKYFEADTRANIARILGK
jgi:predicted metal-dependent HD superfamily phosphohydrolase